MKKYVILFFVFCSTALMAQQPPQGDEPPRPARERVEAMKVGFLTQRLNLTPEEAKTFWPVYNKYQDELEALRKSHRDNFANPKTDFDEMPEKDVEKAVDSELTFRQNELDILKKYHSQFKQVLPIKKVAKLYRAEEDFKRELLDRIRENRQNMKRDRMDKRKPGDR